MTARLCTDRQTDKHTNEIAQRATLDESDASSRTDKKLVSRALTSTVVGQNRALFHTATHGMRFFFEIWEHVRKLEKKFEHFRNLGNFSKIGKMFHNWKNVRNFRNLERFSKLGKIF